MTRAQEILEGVLSTLGHVAKTYGPGLGVAGAAAGLGASAALARKARNKKIKDAGYGKKLQYAKDKVTVARVKSAKALGLSKKRRQAVKAAKNRKQRLVNKGLHAFAQKVANED